MPIKIEQAVSARRALTEPERRLILENQCNKCVAPREDCKLESLSGQPYDIDHKIPLQFGGNNDSSNLQALCVSCHREKTNYENTISTILRNGGNQGVVLPDNWPRFLPNMMYSKSVSKPIIIYIT